MVLHGILHGEPWGAMVTPGDHHGLQFQRLGGVMEP